MEFWELLAVAVGLSMDAFAIAICKGLSVEKVEKKHLFITGLWFGGAQASAFGVWLGNCFGEKYRSKAELAGGVILIIMGLKILIEHLNIFD